MRIYNHRGQACLPDTTRLSLTDHATGIQDFRPDRTSLAHDDSSSAPLLQRDGSALTNMSTDHAHNIQGQRTQQHARLRMPQHWAVVKIAAQDSMLLFMLAHVLVHVLDEGVIRV